MEQKFNGKLVGTFGDVSCFSFYATKHMTTGEGGILCTNDKRFIIFVNHLETMEWLIGIPINC